MRSSEWIGAVVNQVHAAKISTLRQQKHDFQLRMQRRAFRRNRRTETGVQQVQKIPL